MYRKESRADVEHGQNETTDSSRNNSGQSETVILSGKKNKRNQSGIFRKYKRVGQKYDGVRENVGSKLTIKNKLLRGFLAELLGTFVFMSFSLGSVAQFIFREKASLLSSNISFGFGLTMGLVICGKVSGGHLNPAVSFANFLLGKITFLRFFIYSIAQTLGAFLASCFVYLVYLHELEIFERGMYSLESAGIFATFPRNLTETTNLDGIELFSNFFDQFFATTLFIVGVLAICDSRNTNIPHIIKAVLVGLILLIIGTSFGLNCGFPVNPARDFGPRLFCLIAGWGTKMFTAGNYFFWIPLVAPMIGAVSGTLTYQLFIANHWPEEDL